ncbi:putative aarF domain-containing protein kinase chloroplastic [Gossypium australe]|uniref:Putative aarF domain-containing protein kinase chloroplastic n=1 Tax=Gossypium australe TaxID=47621 RepID=A0A5B6UJ14_9ROSI|nr:putative aarF domain-containing protein kinase chloroplastic [Gossypium australe]
MASSSLPLQELHFLSPRTTSKHRFYLSRCSSLSRVSLAGNGHLRNGVVLRSRVRAIKEEGVSYEEREREFIKEVNGGFGSNGNGSASKYEYKNGPVEGYNNTNGGVGVVESESNGSLVKYVNGNGNGAAAEMMAAEVMQVVEKEGVVSEEARKKRVEDIGKEEAWFKRSIQDQVEVSVAPGGRWSRFKTYSTIQRTLEIWGFVLTFAFKAWLNNQKFSYQGGMTEEKKVLRRKALAKWLKESILRLGPTFIKIGQQFSTRVDILAQEYVDQLSELQDQVPPFPSETAVSIVEEELGAPVGLIFDRFDYEPIAAASLGQVHRAKLKGQEVVVKVQRPGLKSLFDIDLKNLRVIAEYLQKIDPKSDGAKRDWVAIYDECASVLYQEIDYTKEAANAELFASNFKDMDYVKVPSIYWEYTTPQVLTMEYVPGIKINKIQALDQLGVDRKRLGRYAVESYLEQILSHGFFHADPHPGNIAVDDFNGGRLIFYDFGMMGSISSNIREGLLEAFYGIYEKDPDKVLQAMIQMGVLVPTGDMTAVRRTAQFFLNRFRTELGFKKPLTKEEKIAKKKERLAAIGEDLLAIAADQPFRFPATFTFVVRSFSVLDGIGKGLDPRFDITEIAKPYALELLKFREAGVEVDFRKRWDRQSRAFYNLFRQADRVEKLAEIIQRLEQGDLKLRVRALESERAFQRVATVQKTVGSAVAAGSLINLATILYLNAIRVPAVAAYVICAFFSFQVLIGIIKVKRFDQRERLITGTA